MAGENCPACGVPRTGAFRFCRSCGHDFDADAPRPEAPPTTSRGKARADGQGVRRVPLELILVGLIAVVLVGGAAVALSGSPRGNTSALASPTLPASTAAGTSAPATAGATAASPTAAASQPAASLATGAPGPAGQPMTVTLAAGWQSVPLTEAAIRNYRDILAQTSPEAASAIDQLLVTGAFKAMTLYAMGFEGTRPTGNLVGSVFPSGGLNLDGMEPLLFATFSQLGATDLQSRRSTLPAGAALVVDFRLPIQAAGGAPTILQDRAFHVSSGASIYQLTFTCYPPDPTACLADADAIATTLVIAR